MHDVQGHLAVIQARHVHAESLVSDELGRELGRFAHDDHSALAEGQCDPRPRASTSATVRAVLFAISRAVFCRTMR